MNCRLFFILISCLLSFSNVTAQDEKLEIFGYFQPTYYHDFEKFSDSVGQDSTNRSGSFAVQQLNLFMQRDLGDKWLGLVNVEFINSYSSSRKWGSLNLEEAWVRYRRSQKFNLKIGLHIPTFNHLNEIKNKTPLLPFITRPLAYETSLGEALPLEELAPSHAFISAYGTEPLGAFKLDYSAYIGNSPNIATTDEIADGTVSGTDNSESILFGTRLGFRWKTVKMGFSATQDFNSRLQSLSQAPGFDSSQYSDVPRIRAGTDFSWDWKRIYSESETTLVKYYNLPDGIGQEFDFSYSLLGYDISDRWSVYTMTSVIGVEAELDDVEAKTEVWAWSPGFVLQALDRISFKGQYHWVRIRDRDTLVSSQSFHRFSVAISVIF